MFADIRKKMWQKRNQVHQEVSSCFVHSWQLKTREGFGTLWLLSCSQLTLLPAATNTPGPTEVTSNLNSSKGKRFWDGNMVRFVSLSVLRGFWGVLYKIQDHSDNHLWHVESNLHSYSGDSFGLIVCSYCAKDQKQQLSSQWHKAFWRKGGWSVYEDLWWSIM